METQGKMLIHICLNLMIFLKAARIEAIGEGEEDDRDATQIINDFVTTLKGKA